ncbi:MAG: glutamine synthetase [Clostridiales bacterium]|nr:glutamine synthetase [Clostridiales bacterium]
MNEKVKRILSKPMVYSLPKYTHDKETLKDFFKKHPNIKFVSLVAVDLGGNDTDEKIPISIFLDDIDKFLSTGVQTDGSSVMLQGIATLNNAKVDLIPDIEANWIIDYNYQHIYSENGLPVGTLRIPAFLKHDGKKVDSRSILKNMIEYFTKETKLLFEEYPHLLEEFGIDSIEAIDSINMTTATELEFWVKTPEDHADEEKLSTSQMLKEQYWKRTKGSVRTAMEEAIMLIDEYGFEPEMGHKEVGGVTATIGVTGKLNHVMEQLEITWKYNAPLQCADNELFIRELIEEVFESHGLEVTFLAKPIEGVAGSGKHIHLGANIKLKNGKYINLFAPLDLQSSYLSSLGWGALMGLLKNYEVVNPFVAATNDAFNRLKPGFEAPVCIVASLGHKVDVPSRNRTVLVGLVRDMDNPMTTRLELRSPNPTSNVYLCIAASYQAILDGMKAMAKEKMSYEEITKEFSKSAGEEKFYLETHRSYRSEKDVFIAYDEEERNRLFGKPPATVWENLQAFKNYPEKKKVLFNGDVFNETILNSYKISILDRWVMELTGRILVENMALVRKCKKLHGVENVTDLDVVNWEKINNLRNYLMKDSLENKSLFTKIREAVDREDYELVSNLQLEMTEKITLLKNLYTNYKRNLLEDICNNTK